MNISLTSDLKTTYFVKTTKGKIIHLIHCEDLQFVKITKMLNLSELSCQAYLKDTSSGNLFKTQTDSKKEEKIISEQKRKHSTPSKTLQKESRNLETQSSEEFLVEVETLFVQIFNQNNENITIEVKGTNFGIYKPNIYFLIWKII